jgi:homocysteine S-methyltransferase
MDVVTYPFDSFLDDRGVVILDGALATELERRGADIDDPLWSAKVLIDAPEMIEELHLDYFRAGADVATTASYQASFEGFAERGLTREEAARLMERSVSLAQRARTRFVEERGNTESRPLPLVAASAGCYGAILHDGSEYRGDYDLSPRQLTEFHRRRLEVLVAGEPDVIAFETVPCAREAEAIARVVEEFPEVPAWVGFSCRNQREVSHGESLAECISIVADGDSIVAAGINCTPPQYVSGLVEEVAGTSDLLLLAYPNSGEMWDASRGSWMEGESGPGLVEIAREWYELGARLIGGCCRTGPSAIAALADILSGMDGRTIARGGAENR